MQFLLVLLLYSGSEYCFSTTASNHEWYLPPPPGTLLFFILLIAACSMAPSNVVRDDFREQCGYSVLHQCQGLGFFLVFFPPKVNEREQASGQYWGRLALPYKEMLQGEQIVNQPWPRIPSQPGSASSAKQMAVWLCLERGRERERGTLFRAPCPSLPLGSDLWAQRQLLGAFEQVKRWLSSG